MTMKHLAWLVVALLFSSWPLPTLRSEVQALTGIIPANSGAAEDPSLSPEAEVALEDFAAKVVEAKRVVWHERMDAETGEVARVSELDPAATKRLEEAGHHAADVSLEEWKPLMKGYWRRTMAHQADQAAASLANMAAQAESYARGWTVTDFRHPLDQPFWSAALADTLTPDQMAKWKAFADERRQTIEKQISDYLERRASRTIEEFSVPLRASAADLQQALHLPAERAEKLDTLVKNTAARAAKVWEERATKSLWIIDEDQRRELLRTGRFYLPTEEKDLPEQQPAWKEGLAALLTPEELGQWHALQEEHRLRREKALSLVLLAVLDEKIAFTEEQRTRLLPLAEKLIRQSPSTSITRSNSFLTAYSLQAAAASAKDEDLTPILDPAQVRHWRVTCDSSRSSIPVVAGGVVRQVVVNMGGARQMARIKATAPADASAAKTDGPGPEPEEAERAISDYLEEACNGTRAVWLAPMLLRVEDAARVAHLEPEALARLQTAARGATEQALEDWKVNFEQNTRASVSDLNPAAIIQRMAAPAARTMPDRRLDIPPEKRSLWEKTLIYTLSGPQQDAWQKELDARSAFRDRAVASAVMAVFDAKNLLTAEQWEKIEPLIVATVRDYGSEFANFYASVDPSPWYLRPFMTLIPFASIPEGILKPILTKEQWDRWSTSSEFSTSNNFWSNIQNNHRQQMMQRAPNVQIRR